MGRRISFTLLYTVVSFIVLALVACFILKTDNWLQDTIQWALPIGIGYFFGSGLDRSSKEK